MSAVGYVLFGLLARGLLSGYELASQIREQARGEDVRQVDSPATPHSQRATVTVVSSLGARRSLLQPLDPALVEAALGAADLLRGSEEPTAVLRSAEQGGETGARIEPRGIAPVDRPRATDERRRPQVLYE